MLDDPEGDIREGRIERWRNVEPVAAPSGEDSVRLQHPFDIGEEQRLIEPVESLCDAHGVETGICIIRGFGGLN